MRLSALLSTLLLFVIAFVAANSAYAVRPGHVLATVEDDGVPWSFPTAERVVAIGDIHGDGTALMTILEGMKLVDERGKWTGGKTHLVFIGDLNDRGGDTRMIFDLVMSLEKQAGEAGGAVHTLLGNHEAQIIDGQTHDATLEEARLFAKPYATEEESFEALTNAFHGDGVYAKWLRSRNTLVRIGNTLFVHGGVEEWALQTEPGRLNATVRAWLAKWQGVGPLPPTGSDWVMEGGQLGVPSDEIEGPLWTRKLAKNQLKPELVRKILEHLGVKRVVFGHTTKNGPIRATYDYQALAIDTGISEYYDGELTALEIEKGMAKPHRFARPGDIHSAVKDYFKDWWTGKPSHFPSQHLPETGCVHRVLHWLKTF